MARPTSIDRLPAEARELIARRRAAGQTIRELHAELAALEVRVSKSALGRHVQRLDAADPEALPLVLDRMRREISALRQAVSKAVRQILAGLNDR